MSERGEGGLPAWAAPYLPEFRRIFRSIELSEGFVLFPIELPGSDIARALARWLEARGYPTLVLEPRSHEEWETLAASLLGAELAQEGVAMVIGPRDVPEGMRWGIRLLNQRRDSAAKHLGRPLLWCGPKEFLDETWREAPDFWSVASVPVRLEMKAVAEPSMAVTVPAWMGAEVEDSPERLQELYEAAKRQGDVRNAARIGIRLADALGHRSAFRRAYDVAVEVRSMLEGIEEPGLQAMTHQVVGRLALARSDFKEAEAELSAAQGAAHATDEPLLHADTLIALGDLYLRTYRFKEAETAYQQALSISLAVGSLLGQATALRALGDSYLRTNQVKDAEGVYQQALLSFIVLDDRLGQANTLRRLGSLYRWTGRLQEAEAANQQALPIFQALGDRMGQGSTLLEMSRHALAQGDFARAFKDGLEALEHYRSIDDRFSIASAHVALGIVAQAAGEPLRSAVLMRGAIQFFTNIDEHHTLVWALKALFLAFRALDRDEQAEAALILAWFHAIPINDPLARQLVEETGVPEPPSDDVAASRAILDAALSECEQELRALGEDPYAPLEAI